MILIRSRRTISFFLLAALLLALFPASEAKGPRAARFETLGRRIESILRHSDARRGLWGVEVVRLADGTVLYEQNAEQLFLPASNMKLFTTAAAVEKLRPDFVFRTTVESNAPPDARGRVGDLVLVGRGDPNLSGRVLPYNLRTERREPADAVFQQLADQVAARRVREVTGNLVADDSYFLYEPFSHNWAAEDLQWGYGAPVTALAFNDNQLFLHVQPGLAVGERALVWLEPIHDYYQLNNRVETAAPRAKKHIFVERAAGSMELDVWGEIPLDAAEDEDTVSIADPPRLAGELFRRALEARGIAVRGEVEVRHLRRIEAAGLDNPFPQTPPRLVLAEHRSRPLGEEIKVINKESQNLHIEMLLRTLGRELKNYGSLTVGLEVLGEFAAQVGVERGERHFADGSGLSREDLVAPGAVIKLLEYMARSPRFQAFFDSLPVAGVDGTIAERFRGTPAAGRIHAKTGTVEHVNALSGYMDLPSGERLIFSVIGNSHPLKAGEGARIVDRIALAIYETFGAQKKFPRPPGKSRPAPVPKE